MNRIKRRRLEQLVVSCHPGTTVGEYVPFFFCPRSVMLYILHMGNHPDLEYTDGQRAIVHLQADLRQTIEWARIHGIRWAFSDGNAGAAYTGFYDQLTDLDKIDWQAVRATDFRLPAMKESKQAEFLVYRAFPWFLVERIGVIDAEIARGVESIATEEAGHPGVVVKPRWYY